MPRDNSAGDFFNPIALHMPSLPWQQNDTAWKNGHFRFSIYAACPGSTREGKSALRSRLTR